MVAKKTAVQQSASGRSRAAAASGGDAKESGGQRGTRPGETTMVDRSAGEKVSAGKPAAPVTPVRKADGKKAADGGKPADGKKLDGKRADGKRATATKAAGKKTAAAAEGPAGKSEKSASGAAATKTAAAKGTARKSTAKKAGAARAAKQTGATTVVAKKTPGTAAAAAETAVPKARVAAVAPGELAVRPGEDPWTPEEVEEARTELMSEALRLRAELDASDSALAGLMRDSGDGAGDDEADTGTKNITREHELALAANAREMLEQTERALEKLDAGTYGLCENCGNPIGKARMQAFPRATLCVECKQKQERRS
ncbi:TraR/DksA family transcriptional regulator [Streptomyces sp. NPDC001228]|uniref:TraR/DksA family transcriptional regulator n=1 Tax=Streptomyces sp. NPDC001228 TaxID=3154381 RepID=UPI003332F51E